MGFPRQECWIGLPFLSPGDHPDLGSEPTSPASQVDSLLLSHWGSSFFHLSWKHFFPGEFCNFMSWLIGNGFPKIHLLRLCSAFIVTKYFKNTVINRPRACMQAQLLTSCPTWRFLPLKTWRCVPPLSTKPRVLVPVWMWQGEPERAASFSQRLPASSGETLTF